MTDKSLKIRPAQLTDIPVLQRWDAMPHVIACVTDDPETNPEEDWDWHAELAERDDGTEFHIAEWIDRPIGVLQTIDPATERTGYWEMEEPGFRAIDIWIGEPEFLGKGLGTKMMEWIIARSFKEHSATAVLIDPLASNTGAHRFYARLGFQMIERRNFHGESDCFVMRLDRADRTISSAPPKAQE